MIIKRLVTILIGIILIAIGAIFLLGNLSGNKPGHIFNIRFNPWESTDKENSKDYRDIDEKDTVNIDGINKIDIEVTFAKVNIISEEREDISVRYYGDIPPNMRTNLNTKSSGDKLTINAKAQSNYKINLSPKIDLYLDIIIPTSYTNSLNLEADLGSIQIEGLELDKLYVKGDLGDINIKNVDTKEVNVESSLGKISINNVSSVKNKLSADVGSIKAKNIVGDLEAETDLGSIELEYDDLNSDIAAKSDSGSIKIKLPKNSSFYIEADTSLGNIKSDFPLEINEKSNTKLKGRIGDGKNKIITSVELGSIKVETK